ncbi:hypothetical protein AEAC466_18960 [Asticcacaulis sp. AC466]|nr:hypothetical protein AEAC466_18960 [Asticcacaulis sp. AC466]
MAGKVNLYANHMFNMFVLKMISSTAYARPS